MGFWVATKTRIIKKKHLEKRVRGFESRRKGKDTEKIFERQCKKEGILFYRIEDGERYNYKSYIKKPQPLDYIVFLEKKPCLIDIKFLSKKPSLSFFYPPKRREPKSSTHKQAQKMMQAYNKEGWLYSGFLFAGFCEHLAFLNVQKIIDRKLDFQLVNRIKEIKF